MIAEIIDFGEHASGPDEKRSDEERRAIERQIEAHISEIYRLWHTADAITGQPPKATKE